MPRVKSDSTITHRIEFSPVERKLLAEIQEDMKKQAVFKQIATGAQSFGFLVLPVGVGIAAYAFWRWAGLGSLPQRLKDGFLDVSEDIAKTIYTPFLDLDLGAGTLNEKVEGFMALAQAQMDSIKAKCAERVQEYNDIINDPTVSEAQTAQAAQDRQTTIDRCQAAIHALKIRVHRAMRAI